MIKRTITWLLSPTHFWLCACVVFIAAMFALRPSTPEPAIRLTGLVLQVLGMCTVVLGIAKTRSFFGQPSLIQAIRQWLASAPFIRRNALSGSASATLQAVGVIARGYSTARAPEGAGMEERLAVVERNIELVHQRITGLADEHDSQILGLQQRVKEEKGRVGQEIRAVNDRLEAFGLGGVSISSIGAVWLVFGIVFATASVEISAWLR